MYRDLTVLLLCKHYANSQIQIGLTTFTEIDWGDADTCWAVAVNVLIKITILDRLAPFVASSTVLSCNSFAHCLDQLLLWHCHIPVSDQIVCCVVEPNHVLNVMTLEHYTSVLIIRLQILHQMLVIYESESFLSIWGSEEGVIIDRQEWIVLKLLMCPSNKFSASIFQRSTSQYIFYGRSSDCYW